MVQRERVILYGAGHYGRQFFESNCHARYDVIGVCDSNAEKWGQILSGHSIDSLEKIRCLDFDKIIITIQNKNAIAEALIKSGVPVSKIYYFVLTGTQVRSYEREYYDSVEKLFFKKSAIQQIKRGLLLESFYEKEYEGYSRIIVFGEKEDVDFVQDFFETLEWNVEIINAKDITEILLNDKIILAGEDYKYDLLQIRDIHNIDNNQWVILPLFDVKNSI